MCELDRCKVCTGDMNCGGFYGRVRPLVTHISRTPFRRTSDTSTSTASDSTSMGNVAELFSRDLANDTPQRRGARTLDKKLDSVLQALKQQDDNAALKSQLRVLEKFDNSNGSNNSSGSAHKKARIPSSLSVSALCFLFNFLFIYYLYRKKLVKSITSQGISLMVHNCEKISILL